MELLVFAACALAVACAAPAAHLSDAQISDLRKLPALFHDKFGHYVLSYVTTEGTIVSETGHLMPNPNGEGDILVYEGEITTIGTDGKTYVTRYTGDSDGFKVEDDHLPESPEVTVVSELPEPIVSELPLVPVVAVINELPPATEIPAGPEVEVVSDSTELLQADN